MTYNEVLSQVRPGAGCPLLHRLRGELRLQAVAGQARHHQPQGHHISCRHFILALMHFTVHVQATNKPVKNTPFPSVTICTEGVNMEAVMEAVSEEFQAWVERRNITGAKDDSEHRANVKGFLSDVFSISPNNNISIEDMALAYLSPDPAK